MLLLLVIIHVCPEPVLVKCSFLYIDRSKKKRFSSGADEIVQIMDGFVKGTKQDTVPAVMGFAAFCKALYEKIEDDLGHTPTKEEIPVIKMRFSAMYGGEELFVAFFVQ